MAVTILGMGESDFWKSTPTKIYELSLVHIKINSPGEKSAKEKNPNMTWYEVLD